MKARMTTGLPGIDPAADFTAAKVPDHPRISGSQQGERQSIRSPPDFPQPSIPLVFSGNNLGIHRGTSVAGNARNRDARVLSEVTTL